ADGDTVAQEASTNCQHLFTLTASAEDCDPQPVVTLTVDGDTVPRESDGSWPAPEEVGTHQVMVTATDKCGNTASVSFSLKVEDTTAPNVACKDLTVQLDEKGHVTIHPQDVYADSADTCGVNLDTLSVIPDTFSCDDLGPNTVTLTVQDDSGNTGKCQATMTVEDKLPPTITCPPDLEDVPTDAGKCEATNVVLGEPITGDNCKVDKVENNAPDSFPKGTTVVTWTVTDTSGNTATCEQTVTVQDHEKPTVTLSTKVSALWPPNHDLVDVGLSLTIADNCDANPVVTLSMSQDEKVDEDTGDGNFSPDAKLTTVNGNLVLRLRAERKGNGDGRVYLIIATVTDASGNVTKKAVAVTVPKSQSRKDLDAVVAQAAAAIAAGVPLAYDSTAGPVIGPKQ
ncbi:MAG: HYR domain-containing protein, partial [Armatimonadetes bacterium]|nr:HYR domain-containing protein [Armatimonadota bacterium]